MREVCYKCFRPKANCYCKFTKPIDCKIKFVLLMHPKEAKKQKTGTGRLSALCLPESEIIMGIDFTHNQQLNRLLEDPKYFPLLMYPDENAWTASKEGFAQTIGDRIPLVIIIDSTWFCSKKMLKLSQNLKNIPRLSFVNSYRSIFTFKKEPEEYCISTIESCYYIIKEFQDAGIAPKEADPTPLMTVFKEMIKFQLQAENDRIDGKLPSTHAKDVVYTKKKEIPTFDD